MGLEQRWIVICNVCYRDHEYEPTTTPEKAIMNALETKWKFFDQIWECPICQDKEES